MAGSDRVRFEMKRDYAPKALKSPDMGRMIMKKVKLGQALYYGRSTKRSGENARKTTAGLRIGGMKRDRLEGQLTAFASHAPAREFGRVLQRGGTYTKEVAAKYGRSVEGRARRRGTREAVLGGDNRKRLSVVKSLEEM